MQPAASQGSVARALTTSRSGNFPLLRRRRAFAAILLLLSALLAVGGFWNWRMLKKVDAIPQAIEDAVSLAHLILARSPGQRIASELVKTKQQRALPSQRLPDTTQIRVPEAALERPMDATGLVSAAPLFLADTSVEGNVPPGGVDVTPDISASPGASGPGVTTAPGSGAPSPGSPPGTLPPLQPKLPPSPSAVPEPQSWATTLVGFGLMGWFVRRRGRNRRLGNPDRMILTHEGAHSVGRATSPP